jgi:hypothetical protein
MAPARIDIGRVAPRHLALRLSAYACSIMKLTQVRYLAAVVLNNLNVTAARKLHASQPGVSKQLTLLEDELGLPLFERDGRNLVGVTPAGQDVVDRARRILEDARRRLPRRQPWLGTWMPAAV